MAIFYSWVLLFFGIYVIIQLAKGIRISEEYLCKLVVCCMMNAGKMFEQDFIGSIKKYNKTVSDDFYYEKWTDSASGFGMDSGSTRFSLKSPYDILLFKRDRFVYLLELKSSQGTSISFSTEDDKKEIKASQIKSLSRAFEYGINAGLVLNFRKYDKTFYLSIDKFNEFVKQTEKKSINPADVKELGGVLIPQVKKKVRFSYDINILYGGKEQNEET